MAEPVLKPIKTIDKPLAQCYPEIADDENEKLLADVHRHWFGKLLILVTGSIAVLLIIVVAAGSSSIAKQHGLTLSATGKSIVAFAALVLVALAAIGTFLSLWIYKQSRMLITDENIIEVRQLGLFSKKISHLNMINVEDVSVHKRGIIQTILDYGQMTIQTAGEHDNFIFPSTPDPDTYRRMVIQCHEQAIVRVGRMGTVPRVEISDNNL